MVLALITSLSFNLMAKDIRTNEMMIHDAPKWVKRVKVEKVADKVQRRLEWSTRRVPVYWHKTKESFTKAHSLGPLPDAVTKKSAKKTEVHISPDVSEKDYQEILGHELVHVIFYQKYKGAIPRWLEEGFANHLSRRSQIDYKWLSQQNLPEDVTAGGHPYQGSRQQILLHYKMSQALVEMLDQKCDLDNLLRLSVERKMANYIKSFCNIKDINKSFRKWIVAKAN